MQCPSCSFDNPEGMRYCGGCGSLLIRSCSECGFESKAEFKFCGGCGAVLDAVEATPIQQPIGQDSTNAEWRQLTVLFCDLVGSTELSDRLDPEELRDVVRRYQSTATAVIERFDGHVAQYLGDGLLVYFGYPQAHEDDARRAVHAGLGIVDAITELGEHLELEPDLRLEVRVGIHTGPVVAGEVGGGRKREQLAMGQTPNLAARLQGMAGPNTVVLSAATQALAQGLFVFKDLGHQSVKGLSQSQGVYRVMEESGVHGRFEVALSRGLTPIVGRRHELEILRRCFKRSQEGEGQVVLVTGEAGIGKSRLVHSLREQVGEEAATWWTCRSSPYTQNSALYPLLEPVRKLLNFESGDSPQAGLRKLEEGLDSRGLPVNEAAPLLAAFLSLPGNGSRPRPELSPQRQKEKTLDILLTLLLAGSNGGPAVLVMEDLHWVDPSTLEFLELLVTRSAAARLFSLFTFRPSFAPPWGSPSHLTQLNLDRFEDSEVERMLEELTGGRTLPDAIRRHLREKTDGVPLFIEELTKTILESDLLTQYKNRYELAEPLRLLDIPATLLDSLTARLDRLGTAKEVAQLGAALGRRFSYELLSAVSNRGESFLLHELEQLVEAGLLHRKGAYPQQAIFTFKHALVQDAAYQSLLKRKRLKIHQRIAQALEEGFPQIKETEPEILAHHFAEAQAYTQAVSYLLSAGRRALGRSAHLEAVHHLTRGLDLLAMLPESPQRNEQEIELRSAMGIGLISTLGYAHQEVSDTYARARQLCAELGATPQLFPVLYALWTFHLLRGDHESTELAQELLQFAERSQDASWELVAYGALGTTAFFRGEMVEAAAHLDRSMERYTLERHRSLDPQFTAGAGFLPHIYDLWCRWLSGYPEKAEAKRSELLALADRISSPFGLGIVLVFAMLVSHDLRQADTVRELAERAIRLANEQAFRLWLALGKCGRGWAEVEQGELQAGIAEIQEGLGLYRSTGAQLPYSYWLSYLVEAYLKAGKVGEGLATVDEALRLTQTNLDCFYEAELHRLKGELLVLRGSQDPAAESSLRKALAVSRRQDTKPLELRAAMSLSRLLEKQDQRDEGRALLAEAYGRFTEGFATRDLKEAEALLTALS